LPSNGIPRYQQIAADLIGAIQSGQLRVGDELPSEHELCDAYGVSRPTVREAFRRVQLQGLISRQQGAVSRVISTELRGYTVSLGSEEETREYAATNTVDFSPVTRRLSVRKAADLKISDPEMFDSGSGLRWLAGVDEPIALTTVHVRRPYSEVIDSLRGRTSVVLFSPICASYGLTLTHIDQETTGIQIPAAAARKLGCAAGDAGLRIVHRFYADKVGLFEVSDEIHPADRFSLTMRFKVAMRPLD
jgi:DNA-binding GntR family transcriptional regulator